MKLVLYTDSLGAGGSQRQLCLLASQLREFGHRVLVLTYNCGSVEDRVFFEQWLAERGIEHKRTRSVPRWQRPLALRCALVEEQPDAVLAFQDVPNLYAEVAGLSGREWGLVVSERSAIPGSQRGLFRLMRLFHVLADEVTTNSQTNQGIMTQAWTWLGARVHVIYNAVDLAHFVPMKTELLPTEVGLRPLRLVVLASHQRLKNLLNVLRALVQLRDRVPVHLRWYGGVGKDRAPLREGEAFIQAHGLGGSVELLAPTTGPREAYWGSDAVLLASWFEGCSNVIGEAMACAKPVLASAVSDNPLIVGDGVSGYLFDPHSPAAIAASIERLAALSPAERRAMGLAGRRRAEALFDPVGCARRYEGLLAGAACGRRGASQRVARGH